MRVMTRVLLLFAFAILLIGCASPKTTSQPVSAPPAKESDVSITKQFSEHPGVLPDDQIKGRRAVIETEKGTIIFTLFADEAPKAVSNFVFLTKEGFYDGLTFHRVEPGFVVQGGDPNGNGTGGPGYKFEDEPVKRSYTRGIVAMANSGPNTNGSQFFIMLADTPLPPQYTIFGEVTAGMDVVDQITVGNVMTSVTIEPQS